MAKKDRPLEGDGFGGSIQLMQLKAGQQDSTSAADDIDTSDMNFIWIFGDCDLYLGTDSGNTIPVDTAEIFGVSNIASIHVSAAVKYTWV